MPGSTIDALRAANKLARCNKQRLFMPVIPGTIVQIAGIYYYRLIYDYTRI